MAPPEQSELPAAVPEMSFWWALLSDRGQRGGVAIAGILVRHATPLMGVLLLNWSAQKFLLLAVINFGWNWTLLGVWNIATSALVKNRRVGKPVPASTWVQMTLLGAVVFCIVTGAFGFPVYYMSSAPPVVDAVWWMALAMTMLGPLPNVVEQIREAVAADLPDEQINSIANKRRQLVMVSIIPIVGAYGLLVNLPYPGTIKAVAVGYVLFSTLCELRPDLSAEFAKELQ
jgi:hypothetical protein